MDMSMSREAVKAATGLEKAAVRHQPEFYRGWWILPARAMFSWRTGIWHGKTDAYPSRRGCQIRQRRCRAEVYAPGWPGEHILIIEQTRKSFLSLLYNMSSRKLLEECS